MDAVQKTYEVKRVLVWELPVRLFHWLNALCITVLAITGFLMANPPGSPQRHVCAAVAGGCDQSSGGRSGRL